ncbi:MAG TPA: Rieske 2Fe-2S domain-containing protein, partial [Dehalococcoidia bacterium]|nr:Rieske 2Fe-2S domain-containing protein [Dehalococcoidia bacterium]
MPAVLAITPEERPVFAFIVARSIPVFAKGTKEQQEVAERLVYISRALDDAPPGPGEIELFVEDIYHLGVRIFAYMVDVEEFWKDRLAEARGLAAVERIDRDVELAIRRYLPGAEQNPPSWNFRAAEAAFVSLGFKFDRLIDAEAPQVRGLYNKERTSIANTARNRREVNALKRGTVVPIGAPVAAATVPALPAPNGAAHAEPGEHTPEHAHEPEDEDVEPTWPRPTGSMAELVRGPGPALSVLSRATYPDPYGWGVEVATGVNADTLAPNRPRKVNVGGTGLMLVNTEGVVCAAARTCPHRGWDLTRGAVENGVITCSLHGAQFELCSGKVVREPYDPAFNKENLLMGSIMSGLDPKHTTDPIQTYPTRVDEDGQ